jgi:thioredoxin 1
MIKKIKYSNFNKIVLSSKKIVIVDFWAPWCGPCKSLIPILEKLAKFYEKKVIFGKLNVDENSNISIKYNIKSIPTLIFFKNGKQKDKNIGLVTKEILINKIDKLL